MTTVPYFHVDAFADKAFAGNQAAVMLLESWPDDAVLQAIGGENNFAETAFLVPCADDEADYELTWFTPTSTVDLCGHATLASGHIALTEWMKDADEVRFRTRKAGVLTVSRDGESYALSLPAYAPEPKERFDEAVRGLGARPQEIASHAGGYHIFRYANADEVMALDPDFRALAPLGDLQFICTAPGTDTDVLSRVFVPGAGVDEDSVTGSAHAALTPYWCDRLGRESFTALQASERKGYLTCRREGDRAVLGGPCVTVVEGRFTF